MGMNKAAQTFQPSGYQTIPEFARARGLTTNSVSWAVHAGKLKYLKIGSTRFIAMNEPFDGGVSAVPVEKTMIARHAVLKLKLRYCTPPVYSAILRELMREAECLYLAEGGDSLNLKYEQDDIKASIILAKNRWERDRQEAFINRVLNTYTFYQDKEGGDWIAEAPKRRAGK